MTYVLSDIHGNLQRFESVLKQINLQPDDTLYILGDVIDRGEHGIEILRKIMTMPNAKMLLGNHEYMMMNALGFPRNSDDVSGESPSGLLRLWYNNGGEVTHKAWEKLSEKERSQIADHLRSLPLNIDIAVNDRKYKLVHAAVEDVYEIFGKPGETKTCYCVWDREANFLMPEAEYTIVFGHTPTIMLQRTNPMEIFRKDNLIGIDCGSGVRPRFRRGINGIVQGRLACLRLDDMKEFYSEDVKLERRTA